MTTGQPPEDLWDCFFFAFLAATAAREAVFARAERCCLVIPAAAFFPPALPPSFPPLAPCFRKNSNASGGNFVLAIPYLTWALRNGTNRGEGVLGTIRSVKAIGYVRVSTEQQADWGVSLDAQTEKVRAMAVVQGARSLEVIVDAESAKSLNRSGMARPRAA